jgi:hypothetical protein
MQNCNRYWVSRGILTICVIDSETLEEVELYHAVWDSPSSTYYIPLELEQEAYRKCDELNGETISRNNSR